MNRSIIIALVLISIPTFALGEGLDDLFGPSQPQKVPFDQVAETCSGGKPLATIAAHDRFIKCMESSNLSGSYSIPDQRYLNRMKETSAQVRAGADYGTVILAEREWRFSQLEGIQDKNVQIAEQRRLQNTISGVAVQQAWWANTLSGLNHSDNWQPRMFINRY